MHTIILLFSFCEFRCSGLMITINITSKRILGLRTTHCQQDHLQCPQFHRQWSCRAALSQDKSYGSPIHQVHWIYQTRKDLRIMSLLPSSRSPGRNLLLHVLNPMSAAVILEQFVQTYIEGLNLARAPTGNHGNCKYVILS